MLVTLRARLVLCLLPALTACGTDTGIRLYPIKGPIAETSPSLLIAVRTDNSSETSGTISFRLPKPDKAKCTGTWSSVTPKVITKERGLSLTLRETGGKVKRSTEDVGGINSGEIYAVCNDGTRVEGHFVSGSGTQSGTGTATDTRGNTYKLLF